MKPAQFEYARAATLEQAISMLQAHGGDARPIAGGQSLVPMLAMRLVAPTLLVDIGRLPGLARILVDDDGIRLGALVRWCDIERSAALASAHPLLCAAIEHVAHYQIRNRGTVGGSLAHADPAAELPGIALACEARIAVAGPKGKRTIAAADFFTGTNTTALAAGELIVELQLPAWKKGRRWAFEEFARRKGHFALAGVTVFFDLDEAACALDPHLAVLGLAGAPRRLRATEDMLAGRRIDKALIASVAAAVSEAVDPPADLHGGAEYRRALLGALTERALARAAGVDLVEAA